jgi:hypothetical protein
MVIHVDESRQAGDRVLGVDSEPWRQFFVGQKPQVWIGRAEELSQSKADDSRTQQ